MTMERQPARLATLNLRSELDKQMAAPIKAEPKGMGLLSPRKMFSKEEEQQAPEAKRVINYMKMIRESMSNGVQKSTEL